MVDHHTPDTPDSATRAEGDRDRLLGAVRAAAAGTPYLVEETRTGFDVRLDVADATWFGLLNAAGLEKVHVHHVRVPEAGRYSITDESRTVSWVAGVPTLGHAERVYGRVRELGVEKVWGLDGSGRVGPVVDYRFTSEEGRDLVAAVAGHLGFRPLRGSAEKAGLIFAAVGGGGALLTAVVLLAGAVLGKF